METDISHVKAADLVDLVFVAKGYMSQGTKISDLFFLSTKDNVSLQSSTGMRMDFCTKSCNISIVRGIKEDIICPLPTG